MVFNYVFSCNLRKNCFKSKFNTTRIYFCGSLIVEIYKMQNFLNYTLNNIQAFVDYKASENGLGIRGLIIVVLPCIITVLPSVENVTRELKK